MYFVPHRAHSLSPITKIKGSVRPRPTALLLPSSDGKPETATAVVVALDDGHEDA